MTGDMLAIRSDTSDDALKRQRQQLTIGDIKRFTRYHLYFSRKQDGDSMCPTYISGNRTEILFEELITRCPKQSYFPRQLTPKQVSWKKSSKSMEKAENKSSGSSSGVNGNEDGEEVISEFLSFSLLLANHPFSIDLYRAVTAVAPMFPRVTFVVGYALDFGELCAQYNVRSFPKMLFFHKGMLKGKHSRAHEAGALVAEITKWTKLLPQSYPVKRQRTLMKDLSTGGSSHVKFNYTWDSLMAWVEHKTGPSVEPIAVSSKFLVQHDSLLFVLSGIYVVFRIFHVTLVKS
jgi:hypothetical protein